MESFVLGSRSDGDDEDDDRPIGETGMDFSGLFGGDE
jgi:hypothetical protein